MSHYTLITGLINLAGFYVRPSFPLKVLHEAFVNFVENPNVFIVSNDEMRYQLSLNPGKAYIETNRFHDDVGLLANLYIRRIHQPERCLSLQCAGHGRRR
jgi:hypothetical protein